MEVQPGDVDTLIAAGTSDGLGTMLLRCRKEWDESRGALELVEKNAATARQILAAVAKSERRSLTAEEERYVEAEQLRTRALVFVDMAPTLEPAVRALYKHATKRALRRSLQLEPHQIGRIVGLALDVWLDQRCTTCTGRGFTGVSPQIVCRTCKGFKHRRRDLSLTDSREKSLGDWLLTEADRLVEVAGRRMRQALR